MATPSVPARRLLPAKESALFKELLSQYEAHQVKKAQKTADQILKKFPEHGETLAMKGLVTFQAGKKEEGLDLIRKGIKYDLTSHIVWHVLGLAKKSEKDYDEAVKSYQQALRYEKDNINILRDAANLYMQLRQYDSLEAVRSTMLRLRPNVRQNWIAMAVSYQLNSNLRSTREVLETYESMLKNIPDYDVEHSEVLLYHVKILELSEDYSSALDFLETNAKMHRIINPLSVMEMRASLLSKVSRKEEADFQWRELLDLNPDCNEYYTGFLANQGIYLEALTDDARCSCIEILKSLLDKHPWSTSAARLLLSVTSDDEFRALVTKYIIDALRRGVPSLFVDLKALLVDREKSRIIRDVVEDICSQMVGDDDPTIYVWAVYFLIQHSSYKGANKDALKWLDILLEHTPTLPEVFALKAKILKRVGDSERASDAMEQARHLDGQDRFVNWKSAKYLLRAGKCTEAQKVLGLFTKKDAPNPSTDLEDMQCLEYLLEEGDAYRRLHNPGMALKRYKAIEKVFSDVEDDQFDFHSYALRKSSVNSYLDTISWEDQLRTHPAYVLSSLGAVKVYLELYDAPRGMSSEVDEERRKAKKKAKKAAAKVSDVPNGPETTSSTTTPKDDDPDGRKLVAVTDPLDQAHAMLKPLETESQSDPRVLRALFDVALRRKKYLQALRVLRCAREHDYDNSEFHLRTVEFLHTTGRCTPTMDPTLKTILVKELHDMHLDEDTPLSVYNQAYLQRNCSLADRIWASFRADQVLELHTHDSDDIVSKVLQPGVKIELLTALDILAYLQKWNSPSTNKFAEHAARDFPLCPMFRQPTAKPGLPNGTHGSKDSDLSTSVEVIY